MTKKEKCPYNNVCVYYITHLKECEKYVCSEDYKKCPYYNLIRVDYQNLIQHFQEGGKV